MSSVDLVAAGYDEQRAKTFQDDLMDRVRALGGVESAALARIAPFSYRSYSSAPITIDGYQAAPDEQPTADYDEVGPAYFATLGIPVVSGRERNLQTFNGATEELEVPDLESRPRPACWSERTNLSAPTREVSR